MDNPKYDKIIDILTDIRIDVAKNTVDLSHHIKRSDLLQEQQKKIVMLLYVGAGIGIALYGPEFIKLLKVVL